MPRDWFLDCSLEYAYRTIDKGCVKLKLKSERRGNIFVISQRTTRFLFIEKIVEVELKLSSANYYKTLISANMSYHDFVAAKPEKKVLLSKLSIICKKILSDERGR